MTKTHTFKYKIPNTEIELEVNCTTIDCGGFPKIISDRYETNISSIFYNGVNILPILEINDILEKIYTDADVDGFKLFNDL